MRCSRIRSLVVCGALLFTSSLQAHAGTWVQFRTLKGDIEVELFDDEKPGTVANFLRYATQIYPTNNVFLHRCIPNFIVQGGGFSIPERGSGSSFTNFLRVPKLPPITNEFSVGPLRSNVYGTIAMAKVGGDPNSASSEWFFNLADNSANLDNQNEGFTTFGRVVGGTNVLNFFNTIFKRVTATTCSFRGVVDLGCYTTSSAGRLFTDLPVNYATTRYPLFNDLFLVDITVLQVKVRSLVDGGHEVSWNSVKDRENVVEYTDVMPPAWKTLKSIVGDGALQKATDASNTSPARFYRVRVVYP